MKLGIKNILPLLMLSVEVGNVADSIGHAKGFGRYAKAMDLFDEVMGLGKVDFKAVKEEIKDLDTVEKAELLAAVKEKLDIEDDKLEIVIEEGLGIIADAYALVERSKSLVKGLKSA